MVFKRGGRKGSSKKNTARKPRGRKMRVMLGTDVSKKILEYLPSGDVPQAGVVNKQFSEALKLEVRDRLYKYIGTKRGLFGTLTLSSPLMTMAYMDMIEKDMPMEPVKELRITDSAKLRTWSGKSIIRPETERLSFLYPVDRDSLNPEFRDYYFNIEERNNPLPIPPGQIPSTVKMVMGVHRPLVSGSIPEGVTHIQMVDLKGVRGLTPELFPASIEKIVVPKEWFYTLKDMDEFADDARLRNAFRFTEVVGYFGSQDGDTWDDELEKLAWEEEMGGSDYED